MNDYNEYEDYKDIDSDGIKISAYTFVFCIVLFIFVLILSILYCNYE